MSEFEEDDDQLIVRESSEVARRILALIAVIGKAHQGTNSKFIEWFQKNEIEQYLSTDEKEFLKTTEPSQKDIINFSWRAEALTSLLWAINLIPEMPALNQQFNVYSVNELLEIIKNPIELFSKIKLKTDEELIEMENELYHQHWRVRDAQLFNKKMPSELNPGIVYERRYAMSWLIGYGDDWDNVPTDT